MVTSISPIYDDQYKGLAFFGNSITQSKAWLCRLGWIDFGSMQLYGPATIYYNGFHDYGERMD